MTDKEYIRGITSGDQEVFVQLYKNFRSEFIGYFRNHFRKPEYFLEELYQDACSALWSNIQTNKLTLETLKSSLKTYLFTIGRNQLIAYDRKKRVVATDSDLDYVNKTYASETYDPDKEERDTLIQRAVDTMPEPCSTLLTNFYWHGMSCKEIAEKMDYKNADSVKSQKSKCMKKIEGFLLNIFKE